MHGHSGRFLKEEQDKAMSISIFDYNETEEMEKIRKAEYKAGYEAGLKSVIPIIASVYLEDGFSDEKIIYKLVTIFHLSEKEAQNYLAEQKTSKHH